MKKTLFTLLLLLSSLSVWAQKGSITAQIIDKNTKAGIVGAVVELVEVGSTQMGTFYTSGYDGKITISNAAYGDYNLNITFMGYADYSQVVKVEKSTLALGVIEMDESATQIDAVVKEVKSMRASQNGDTISYNASAFKVTNDSDIEGLLKKMPGITITDGEVTAQGETIQKILVDGREFFGDDITTALNSLPAEVVDKIDVYNKLSDDAELSGMDDGEGYKAINIVTHKHMREGLFGKVYGGYGYQPEVQDGIDKNKYVAGGNVNMFKGNHRLTLLGLFNNINQQNFSFEDIVGVSDSGGKGGGKYMVRPQSGIATVNAVGLNYSGVFGADDKLKVEASYFFNGTNTVNNSTTSRWYEAPNDLDTLYSETISETLNYNHRATARVEWKITPYQSLNIRHNTSIQDNDPYSTTTGSQYGESGYTILNSMSDNLRSGYYTNTGLSYIARLGKVGRTLSLNGGLTINDYDNTTRSYSNGAATYIKPDGSPVTALDTIGLASSLGSELVNLSYLYTSAPTSSQRYFGSATYAEPVSDYSRVTLKYYASISDQQTEKDNYNTSSDYSITGLTPNTSTSNSYESTYLVQQIGPGFYYSKDKSKLSLGVQYQHSTLRGNTMVTGDDDQINRDFDNFTYNAMGHLYLNAENSLRLYIRSSTSEPSISNLVDAYNISNTQYISKGNSNLAPSYSHNVNFHYTNSNIEKGSTFMFRASMTNTSDYVAQHVILNPEAITIGDEVYTPLQYTQNVNMDNFWKANSAVSYGFPISPIKCNLNLEGGVSYQLTPSMLGGSIDENGDIYDGVVNNTENMAYNVSAVLGSNISENVDFTLSWRGAYNEATNSASQSDDVNTYFSQTASATMKFIFSLGLTFTGSATYNQYKGITNDYNDDYLQCNAFIGKKFLKNNRAELSVGVNDILNQNTSFSRNIGSGYTENVTNSVIGRYFTVQLVYNLRSFGGKEESGGRPSMGGGDRPPMGGRPDMF